MRVGIVEKHRRFQAVAVAERKQRRQPHGGRGLLCRSDDRIHIPAADKTHYAGMAQMRILVVIGPQHRQQGLHGFMSMQMAQRNRGEKRGRGSGSFSSLISPSNAAATCPSPKTLAACAAHFGIGIRQAVATIHA